MITAARIPLGTRLAVLVDDGEYYLATTVEVLPKGTLVVKYDDGTRGEAPKGSYLILDPFKSSPNPDALSEEQVQPLLHKEESEDEEPTTEEQKLTKIVSDRALFQQARLDKGVRKKYLTRMFNRANDWFFDSKLVMPELKLIPDVGTRMRTLGMWHRGRSTLSVSTRLFNAQEHMAVMVIVHEMCHQAVSHIDFAVEGNGGHGPLWGAHMKACGLTPSRYFKGSMDVFYKPEEVYELALKRSMQNSLQTYTQRVWPKRGLPAVIADPKSGEYIKGFVACARDKTGKRWVFVSIDNKTSIVAAEDFYEWPNQDPHQVPSDVAVSIKKYQQQY